MSAHEPTSRLMVFMFTDLVDSSALTRRLGDADYVRNVRNPHNALFRQLLAEYPEAREVDFTGDGFLATFVAASDAAEVALRFHQALQNAPWNNVQLTARVGIHLGEAIEVAGAGDAGHDLAGDAINMASRVMSLAEPGQSLLTRTAFDSARQSGRVRATCLSAAADESPPAVAWLNHGAYRFKGAEEPFEVCEVGLAGCAPLKPPRDSEKARRAVSEEEAALLGWRPSPNVPIPHRPDWMLVRELGEGGFGEVWLARHRRTKEERAYKFCFNHDRLRAFKRELTFFRLIRDHLGERPDIGRLFEVQVDEPPFFLEGEYIPAGNWKDWADARGGITALPLEERLRMLAEVARAVAAAHSLGIIHKDLKPSNVLISERDGRAQPKLVDFGIGVLADRTLLDQHQITGTGFSESLLAGNGSSRTGTRMYLPPEAQLHRPPTTAGDVYALGVILYQLVIGDFSRPLGTGWEDYIADELLREDIHLCTHGEPTRRLAGAGDLAQHLETLAQRRAAREQQSRLVRQAQRLRRLRVSLAAAITALVVLGGLAGFIYRQWQHADAARQAATTYRLATQSQAMLQEWPERSLLLAAEAVNRSVHSNRAPLPVAVQALRDSLAQVGGRRLSIVGNQIAFSPDKQWLVTGSNDGTARLYNLAAGAPDLRRVLTGHAARMECAAFSSDGRWLATGSHDEHVQLWDLHSDAAAANPIRLTLQRQVDLVAFSPNSRWLFAGSALAPARIWDLTATNSAESEKVLGEVSMTSECVAFSPDSRWLATGRILGASLWDLNAVDPSASPIWLSSVADWREPAPDVLCVAFASDSKWVLTGSSDGYARIWNLEGMNPAGERILLYHGSRVTCAIVRDWIFTGCSNGSIHKWRLPDSTRVVDQTPITVLRGHMGQIRCLALENGLLASGSDDKTVGLWNIGVPSPAADQIILRGHEAPVTTVAIDEDSHLVFAGSDDGSVRAWQPHVASQFTATEAADYIGIGASERFGELLSRRWAGCQGASPVVLGGSPDSGVPIAINHDGSLLFTTTRRAIRILKLESADFQGTAIELPLQDLRMYSIWDHALSPNDRWLATADSIGTIAVWDMSASRPAANATVLRGPQATDTKLTFSGDSNTLMITRRSPHIVVVDLKSTPATAKLLDAGGGNVQFAAISADNRWLVADTTDTDLDADTRRVEPTMHIWDLTVPDPQVTHEMFKNTYCLVSSPDHRLLLVREDNTFQIRSLAPKDTMVTPKTLPLGDGQFHEGVFSPDSRWLVTAVPATDSISPDRILVLWNITSAKPVPHHIKAVASGELMRFSPDGRWLITCHNDQAMATGEYRTARLWDLHRKDPTDCPILLLGHSAPLRDAAFSLETGRTRSLVTADSGECRLWDLASEDIPESAVVLRIHSGRPTDSMFVRIAPGNRWLVVGDGGTIRLWNLRLNELIAQARETAGRELTREERHAYMLEDAHP